MRLFIASICNRKFCIDEIGGIDYFLESFWYMQPWEIPLIKQSKMFLLDSGAFTFLNSQKHNGKINLDDYLNKYINFINKHDIQYFFELDIDSIVGLKEVERLRDRLERETGKKSIPVWHFNRGKDYFVQMCRDYDYVAFGGIITDGIKTKDILKYLTWFSKTAHENNSRLHTLGLTCNGIEKYGVDSADSTSWKSGGLYGHLYKFNGKGMSQVSFNDKKISNYRIADTHNLKEWIKYQKYLDR